MESSISEKVSDAFPKKYADALKKGLESKEAILWARVEAFRKRNGELEAGNSLSLIYFLFV